MNHNDYIKATAEQQAQELQKALLAIVLPLLDDKKDAFLELTEEYGKNQDTAVGKEILAILNEKGITVTISVPAGEYPLSCHYYVYHNGTEAGHIHLKGGNIT